MFTTQFKYNMSKSIDTMEILTPPHSILLETVIQSLTKCEKQF